MLVCPKPSLRPSKPAICKISNLSNSKRPARCALISFRSYLERANPSLNKLHSVASLSYMLSPRLPALARPIKGGWKWIEGSLLRGPSPRFGLSPHGSYQASYLTTRAYQRVWQRSGKSLTMFRWMSSMAAEFIYLAGQPHSVRLSAIEGNATPALPAVSVYPYHVLQQGNDRRFATEELLSTFSMPGWSPYFQTFLLKCAAANASWAEKLVSHNRPPLPLLTAPAGWIQDEDPFLQRYAGNWPVEKLEPSQRHLRSQDPWGSILSYLLMLSTGASGPGNVLRKPELPASVAPSVLQFLRLDSLDYHLSPTRAPSGSLLSIWALAALGRHIAHGLANYHPWSLYYRVDKQLLVTFKIKFCILNRRVRKRVKSEQKYRRVFCRLRSAKRTVSTARFINYFTKFTPIVKHKARVRHLMFEALISPDTSPLVISRERQQAAVLTQLMKR